MKKYTSQATKRVTFLIVICTLIFLIGFVLIIVDISNKGLQIGLTLFGGFTGFLLLCCFFAEKSRCLIIDADKIVLPRGVDINGKAAPKRTVINTDEIISLKIEFYKGDNILTNGCFFYTLKLKGGTKITFTLFSYGKEAEKEIIETIKNGINKA